MHDAIDGDFAAIPQENVEFTGFFLELLDWSAFQERSEECCKSWRLNIKIVT